MEKEHTRKINFLTTPLILLLVLPLLYVNLLWANDIHFDQSFSGIQYFPRFEIASSSRKVLNYGKAEEKQGSLNFILSRIVKGEDRKKFEANGFACDKEVYSIHCVSTRPVQIDTRTMTVTVPSNQPFQETVIRPYARQEDDVLLKTITPVKIIQGNGSSTPPVCNHNHTIPAVIFSTGGFRGNVFHEINEILIPLFITTRIFKSRVQFVVDDYSPQFMKKYRKPLSLLTDYEILNPSLNKTVHCFPGGIVGLKFHGHLSINSREIPTGLSIRDFRQFLRQSFGLKYSHVSQIERPTVMLLSRRTTRRFINEDEMVAMMEELGFRVIVVARAKVFSNIEVFANMINSCSVFVGAHGAGLTNELFLPDGAVMIQFDLIGLDWAAAAYYGNPARAMGVHYLRYKIEPEESSLLKVFGSRDHLAITDPYWLPVQAGKEVYLNGQNVKVNIERFRNTMVEALSLVQDSAL